MTTETAETHELVLQAQALERENITEKVLVELETRYTGLNIKGPDDKAGLQLVHDARMQCRSLRVLAAKICKAGREEAVAEQRRWLTAEKLVTARIEAVEKPLQLEEERITAEVSRLRKEKAEAEGRMIAERTRKMNEIGGFISYEDAKAFTQEQFDIAFGARTAEFEAEQEAARIEAERLAAEQAERDRLAAEEATRIKEQQAELRQKQEELEAREREIREREEASRREAERLAQERRHAAELEEARKQAAEKAATEERRKAEQAERAKIEAEAAEKRRIEEERQAAELMAAQAPDREKLLALDEKLMQIELPEMQSEFGTKAVADVAELLRRLHHFIIGKVNQM
jgi:chemosensory pili system protein ChpA (sensor histidine kinase/response regulator)